MTDEITEIKNAIKNNTLVVGKNVILKSMNKGTISKIFLSSNISAPLKTEVETYANIAKVPVSVLQIPSDELKVLCKKAFLIAVLAIKK